MVCCPQPCGARAAASGASWQLPHLRPSPQVFQASLKLLKMLITQYIPKHRLSKLETAHCVERTVPVLLARTGDSSARLRAVASNFIQVGPSRPGGPSWWVQAAELGVCPGHPLVLPESLSPWALKPTFCLRRELQ